MKDQDKELLERFVEYIKDDLKRIKNIYASDLKRSSPHNSDYIEGVMYGLSKACRELKFYINDFEKYEDKQREEYFTLGEIRRMTPDEVKENWNKVQKSMRHISGQDKEDN